MGGMTLLGAGKFPAIVAGSSVITSIQQGSITIAAGSNSNTATLSPTVTAANSMLVYNGVTTDLATSNHAKCAVRITLTNGTTVTATRELNSSVAVTVNFSVVEFASGVNSIQYNTITITAAGTSNTRTISAVGANAFVMWLGGSVSTASLAYADVQSGVTLTNSTTVTGNIGFALANDYTMNFVVVDLDSTIVASVQQRTLTSAATATTDVDTISSISTTDTLLVNGGNTAASTTTFAAIGFRSVLTNATTVTFTRNGIGVISRTHYYTAVVFAAAVLKQAIQSATITLSAAASGTATITAVVTAKSFVMWEGAFNASANANVLLPRMDLTNTTTVTANLNASGSVATAFSVVEFN